MAAPVYLEVGSKKVFACSMDWPGWARSGKTDEAALEALEAYADRYAAVAEKAGTAFRPGLSSGIDVVERVKGDATTDFGAPSKAVKADEEPLTKAQADRLVKLLEASWAALDEVAAKSPASLRKGPRGGGRDRDKMVQHVLSAEGSYARMIGVRHPEPQLGDAPAIEVLRTDIVTALRGARAGEPLREKGWRPRYAIRRIAWHVLDHAWEMEDRSE